MQADFSNTMDTNIFHKFRDFWNEWNYPETYAKHSYESNKKWT